MDSWIGLWLVVYSSDDGIRTHAGRLHKIWNTAVAYYYRIPDTWLVESFYNVFLTISRSLFGSIPSKLVSIQFCKKKQWKWQRRNFRIIHMTIGSYGNIKHQEDDERIQSRPLWILFWFTKSYKIILCARIMNEYLDCSTKIIKIY